MRLLRPPANYTIYICSFPVLHPSDIREECFHIHAIQNMIMAREAYRSNPETFPVKNAGAINLPIGIVSSAPLNFVSFDAGNVASKKVHSSKKYRMRKLRILKVLASEFSLSEYIRLEKLSGVTNFQIAYFLQVRIMFIWFNLRSFISVDSAYSMLCATESMEKLQEQI